MRTQGQDTINNLPLTIDIIEKVVLSHRVKKEHQCTMEISRKYKKGAIVHVRLWLLATT